MPDIAEITGRPSWNVAVVLGSGLSEVAESLVDEGSADFSDISGLPETAVEGHAGRMYYGTLGEVPTLVFAGRIHLYEGHDARDVTALVRSAIEAGCNTIVLTNAAGGLNSAFEVGAPVLIRDHLNLTGNNPLRGPHDKRGPRFLDMSDPYDGELRRIAKEIDPSLQEGVYAGLSGPTYETPAEIAMLQTLGADMVGMSTVLETIEPRYLGAKVLGISLITNPAAGLKEEPLSHDEVAEAGRAAGPRLGRLLHELIPRLG